MKTRRGTNGVGPKDTPNVCVLLSKLIEVS